MTVYIKIDKKIKDLLQKVDLDEKSEKLKIKKIMKNFKTIYKNG